MTWLGSSWTRWAVLVWVALFALGCSGGSRKDELELELEGRTFLLQSTRGDTPVTGTNISIEFREHELRFGACNLFTADFSLCDGRVCIMGYSKTEIGCDAERSEQDAWLASFFTDRKSVV